LTENSLVKKLLLLIPLVLIFNGCGTLIPKRVEFFQDKVKKYPELTVSQKEVEKQAAQRAKESAAQTLQAALAEQSSTNVIAPATDTAKLTDAVALVVGPPAKSSVAPAEKLAQEVRSIVAKQDRKEEAFKQDNNENAGKKIEGTGLLQIPYFVYVGLIALVLIIAWHIAHTVLTGLQAAGVANPLVGVGASVGLGAMNVTNTLAAKGFSQLVKGGEAFKDWVKKEVSDPALQGKILEAFRINHQSSQDEEVQNVVKAVTK
jgi:hypothetical protein